LSKLEPETKTTIHIGFDDTDSLEGGCTTYLALAIINQIAGFCKFLDYPRLIRNNPNIPWKTRGNGSIALSVEVRDCDIEKIKEACVSQINKHHRKDENTNPGLVIIKGEIPTKLKEFSIKALIKHLSISEAKTLAEECSYFLFSKGNGRGLIGALAAVGNQLKPSEEDFTFELLAYRTEEFIGTKRKVKKDSVYEMDKQLTPNVFNNIDSESNKILICPAGKDPVFFGIRGEKASDVLEALSIIETDEPFNGYCIFRTNQGTDQHFKYADSSAENYSVFKGLIQITEKPETIMGGHVFLKGNIISSNQEINLAAFEPSKSFKKIIKQLLPEDRIFAYGGVKYKEEFEIYSVHLEKCEITQLTECFIEEAPFCPECSKRMTSDGYQKGYKCRSCGYKDKKLKKIRKNIKRALEKGLYIPPEQAQRHLVKPLRRYTIEPKNTFDFITDWWKKYAKA